MNIQHQSMLLALPVELQRNIYQRAPDIQTVLQLRKVCHATQDAVARTGLNVNDVDANSAFNREWVSNLSDDQVMRVWEHCLERDGRDADGNEVPGRRELQFDALTSLAVLTTYPETHLAIALLRALERRNGWFVDRLTSPQNPLVPMHMTGVDAQRLQDILYNPALSHLGWVNLKLSVEGRHDTMAQVQYHRLTARFTAPRGVMLLMRDVVFPPALQPEDVPPLPPTDLIVPAAGPLPACNEPPITLVLGPMGDADASQYRFALGFRTEGHLPGQPFMDVDPGGLMLGINPHPHSWDEMVIDAFEWDKGMRHFIMHLLDYPLIDMNVPSMFGYRPLYRAVTHLMPGEIVTKLLERPEMDASLSGMTTVNLTPLFMMTQLPLRRMNSAFEQMVGHPSMAHVHDHPAFVEAVITACEQHGNLSAEARMQRVRLMAPNHKFVTLATLRRPLEANRFDILQELLAEPHPHTPLTRDTVRETLIRASQQGRIGALPILLACPVAMSAEDIAETISQFEEHAAAVAMPDATRQAIRAVLDRYVAPP